MWNEALEWLVDIIEEAVLTFNMYSDKPDIGTMSLETIASWLHNYPIPDDELDNKTASIAEVEAGVRSKKSYIEEFSNSEDAEAEFQRILDEQSQLNEVNNSAMFEMEEMKLGVKNDKEKEKDDEEEE